MQGDQDDVVREDVDGFGPALHRTVSSSPQLGEEEGVEGEDFQPCCFTGAPLHDQVEVEVYHLQWKQTQPQCTAASVLIL